MINLASSLGRPDADGRKIEIAARTYQSALTTLVASVVAALLFPGAVFAGQTQPTIATGPVLPPTLTNNPQMAEFWEAPTSLAERDLFNGPWGAQNAPDPDAVYTFIEPKKGGINPGMTVRDPRGREWKVKQPPTTGRNAEGPIEVVLSRVLSAVGFHQPPVYFLPSVKIMREGVTRTEPGGRFRLKVPSLKDLDEWSWLDNPYAGTRPHHGLLVILLMFNSSDLKTSNNTLYQYTAPDGAVGRWFVVRDLGTALGSTARLTPIRGNPDVFERKGFIERVENGFVTFDYDGRHQELVTNRITPADVRWASYLLSRLTPEQWQDAFRAGGYQPAASERFIRRIQEKVSDGLAFGETTVR